MEHVKRFLNQRKTLVLSLVLLVVSMALNMYQYSRAIKPWYAYEDE